MDVAISEDAGPIIKDSVHREIILLESKIHRGRLLFLSGYVLTFMEYIQMGKERPKYRFNLSDSKGEVIFRYDNAAHHKEIITFPHHKHVRTEVKPSKEVGLADVVAEIENMILNEFSS
ncbi:MAG: DUF6516 family protein [Candidatus Methanoperedens sp.]|nr:DUF6516 family protein [Candidatus Methanoperedens sp.]